MKKIFGFRSETHENLFKLPIYYLDIILKGLQAGKRREGEWRDHFLLRDE